MYMTGQEAWLYVFSAAKRTFQFPRMFVNCWLRTAELGSLQEYSFSLAKQVCSPMKTLKGNFWIGS